MLSVLVARVVFTSVLGVEEEDNRMEVAVEHLPTEVEEAAHLPAEVVELHIDA